MKNGERDARRMRNRTFTTSGDTKPARSSQRFATPRDKNFDSHDILRRSRKSAALSSIPVSSRKSRASVLAIWARWITEVMAMLVDAMKVTSLRMNVTDFHTSRLRHTS